MAGPMSPDDGTYTLSFDEKLGNRGFSVVFSKKMSQDRLSLSMSPSWI